MGLGSGALRLDCKISSMFYDFVGEGWAKPSTAYKIRPNYVSADLWTEYSHL